MTESREHLAGGRPWRWVFESVRAAQEPASLIPNLLVFAPTIIQCCSQIPPHEVADDVTLVVQAVSDRWLRGDSGAEASRICGSTCNFIRKVLECQRLVFTTRDSWLGLLHFFQGTISSASSAILLGEDGGAEAGRAKVEAVAALGQFLLQGLDGSLFTVEDVSEVVLFVSGLLQCPATPASSSAKDEVEAQRLAFVVTGSLMRKARPLVSNEAWTTAVQALLVILDSLVSKKAVVEDYAASRYYVDFLRCVYITVSKPEERLKEHVGAFVQGLRMFFHYGVNISQGETWQEEETGRHHGRDGSADTADSFSFSPGEEGVADFRGKSSEIRMYSMDAIQAILRADPEGVQQWSPLLLLPDMNLARSRSDETTLLSVLRFEPLTKIRAAAATTLVVVLELWPCLQDSDSALSGGERQMFLGLQAGLVYTISNEKHNDTLIAALKALYLFISTAPFSQLPSDLLSNTVLSINEKLRGSNYYLTQSSVLAAAVSCFRASLSIPPSSAQLHHVLSNEAPTESSNLRLSRSLLVDLITYSQAPAPTAVQVEAIQALMAAAHNYPSLLVPYWDDIFKVVQVIDTGSDAYAKNISAPGLVQSSHDELVRSAIELLGELLRVASGMEVAGEDSVQQLLCSPRFGAHRNPSSASEQSEEDGSLQWLLALERLLPGVLRHSSPMVRGAGLSCLAKLTPAVFCSLPAPKQEFILSTLMRASEYDDTPAVRSAACRAVGVIVGFPQASKRPDQIAAFLSMLISRMDQPSSTPQERNSVLWAIASICDGLCSHCTLLDPMEAEHILGHLPIGSLLACIFKTAEDADIKVSINALWALGQLGSILNFTKYDILQEPTSSDLLGTAVQTFLSCSASQNVEVQWNVCQAVGNLFQNQNISLSTSVWAAALFDLLQSLLHGSESVQVKMYAAAALEVPESREDYGTSYGEVVRVVAHTLKSMDTITNTRSAIEPAAKEPAAKDQLARTLLHLLGLGASKDYLILKDVLEELASFLQRWLTLSILEVRRAPEVAPEAEVWQAVKALIDMYMYGGNASIAKKFQALL